MTISFAIALYEGWLFMIFYQPILLGFIVSVLTGIFFGFFITPYKASKLLWDSKTLRGMGINTQLRVSETKFAIL